MNKYQICLQSIVDAIALLFGYAYSLGDAKFAGVPYEFVQHKFLGFGYSKLSEDDRVFWAFGKFLLVSRLRNGQTA